MLLAGLLVASLGTMAATGAVAADSDSDCDGLTTVFAGCAEQSLGDRISEISAYASGSVDRTLTMVFNSDVSDARETADGVQEFVNDHEASMVEYYNSRVTAPDYNETVIIRLTYDDGDARVSNFLVAEFDDESLAAVEVTDTAPGIADEYIVFTGIAEKDLPEVLEDVHSEFVKPDEDIDRSTVAEMAGKYCADIDTSIRAAGDCK